MRQVLCIPLYIWICADVSSYMQMSKGTEPGITPFINLWYKITAYYSINILCPYDLSIPSINMYIRKYVGNFATIMKEWYYIILKRYSTFEYGVNGLQNIVVLMRIWWKNNVNLTYAVSQIPRIPKFAGTFFHGFVTKFTWQFFSQS